MIIRLPHRTFYFLGRNLQGRARGYKRCERRHRKALIDCVPERSAAGGWNFPEISCGSNGMNLRGQSNGTHVFLFILFCVGCLLLPFPVPLTGQSGQSSAASGSNRNFDGPAELPREHVKSSLKDTPANGKEWSIHSTAEIKDVLADAACGDVIELEAGVSFSGNIILPAKNCDDFHWIIIRTSSPDSALPPEGKRLTPCYAGVASLPGRPSWNCASLKNVLAKIEFSGSGGPGPILFAPGANHYRLMGLEVTATTRAYNLVEFMGAADHIVFDRVWMHGSPQGEMVRGIMLGQTRYVAIVESTFSDFHCIAKSGTCGDTQAIAGGIGDGPMGPYKIVNNFLEASGENIMFGGGQASATPADIEIQHNHMFKPLLWLKGQPGFTGGPDGNAFIAKNLFELKNAQRVLLEGNVLEGSWGGFTQGGFGIVLTPKNAGGCPRCQVTDVTVRYNVVSHIGSGIQIANAPADNGANAIAGERYSIHDVVIDDMDGAKYDGPSEFAQISVFPGAPLLQNLTINHLTAFPSRMLFIVGDMTGKNGPMKHFVFTNNIVNSGTAPVWSSGGGPANCAYHDVPVSTFESCFSDSAFAANAIIGSPSGYGKKEWPPNNFFPSSPDAVKFVNYNGGKGGDYRLQLSSPYKGKGIDGKDLGADLDAIRAATAGVE